MNPLSPNRTTRRTAVLSVFLMLLAASLGLMGCGLQVTTIGPISASGGSQDSSSLGTLIYQSIDWDTGGGGDLAFTVTPVNGGASYLVHLTRSQFQSQNQYFVLNPAASQSVYSFVHNVFLGVSHAVSATGCGTGFSGSFSTVTLTPTVGSAQSIDCPTVTGEPSPNPYGLLSAWVSAQI